MGGRMILIAVVQLFEDQTLQAEQVMFHCDDGGSSAYRAVTGVDRFVLELF